MSDKLRMSASQATLFNNCPLLWSFKYLDKVKPDRLITYDATLFGSALHTTLEKILVLNESNETKLEKAPLIFLKEFKELYNKNKNEGYQIIIAGGSLEKAIKSHVYASKIGVSKILNHEIVKKYKKIICEDEFKYENEYFEIIAKIDMIGFYEDGSYDITDFKTGKHFSFGSIKDELQALFYIMACYDRYKKLPKTFRFLKYDKTNFSLKDINIDEEITMETIEYFNKAIKKLSEEIKTSIETNTFKKHDHKQNAKFCQWCSYRQKCSKV